MIARYAVLFAAVSLLTACAEEPVPEIPAEQTAVVRCLYDTIRATPRVRWVAVFVIPSGPIVEYTYNNKDDDEVRTDLYISGPTVAGRFQYASDFMPLENPLAYMSTPIATRCKADGFTFNRAIPVSSYERRRRIVMEGPPPRAKDDDGSFWPSFNFWPFK